MMAPAARFAFEALKIPEPPDDDAWSRLLAFADRTQLTLFLDRTPAQPAWVSEEIRIRAERNAERLRRLQAAYREISSAFASERIDYVLLKGFTHAAFGVDSRYRVQYDFDLLCQPEDATAAAHALERLGYAPHSAQSLSDQHPPPLVKPFDWKWKGDYFDPDIPVSIDLHTRIWNDETDRIRAPGADLFWQRRRRDYHAFALADRVAFAALHALRHILRNDARPAHVFELACFLEKRAHDYEFWNEWPALHGAELRRLQAIVFRFAREWFHCAIPQAVQREMDNLSPRIQAWFDDFAWSPAHNLMRPNKDVIWLHFALLTSASDRMAMLARRLVPLHCPAASGTASFGQRLRYHVAAVRPVLASGLRWWRRSATC